MNAILLGCYPVIYTNTETPLNFTTFSDLISLDDAMSYITDNSNAEDIKNKLTSLYDHFLQKDNYLSGLIDIFNTLGYTKETQTLSEIKGDIINDRIANR